MTTYAHVAAVVDRFLSQWELPPADVIAVTIYPSDVTVQIRRPLEQVEWRAEPCSRGVMYRHHTIREDVPISVHVFTHSHEKEATA
ncbi:hypothetical protein ACTXMZ_13015 [Brachybacterium alimentarium]|uniref:hypothetical protein n=1 Tax=Brachybacterium alimentarium TaxID=47845 RepID=UPI003FCF1DAB